MISEIEFENGKKATLIEFGGDILVATAGYNKEDKTILSLSQSDKFYEIGADLSSYKVNNCSR
jgi:hypothetical protein